MNLVLKATQFAAHKHCDQRRKDGKTPYIIHPISVAMILAEIGGIDDHVHILSRIIADNRGRIIFTMKQAFKNNGVDEII